jgi:N-acetylglutamate synthase-like GNAT family acetyltransferase
MPLDKMHTQSLSKLPDDLLIREYRAEDLKACEEIYTSNIEDFLPPALNLLLDYLEGPFSYYLVAEINGEIVSCGGLDLMAEANQAAFNFGMVRRDWHGRGLGSLLTLTRLGLIEAEHDPAYLGLETTLRTESFYQRFGFERLTKPEQRYVGGSYYVSMGIWLSTNARNEIRAELAQLPVRFELEFPP